MNCNNNVLIFEKLFVNALVAKIPRFIIRVTHLFSAGTDLKPKVWIQQNIFPKDDDSHKRLEKIYEPNKHFLELEHVFDNVKVKNNATIV